MNSIYQKFNVIPNQYIIKILYRNTYNRKLINIIREYGKIQTQYDYCFMDDNFVKCINYLKKEKNWHIYFDELNTIEYQHDDMNILQNTGLVLINKKNDYIFFNNSLTQWYPSTKIMTINLEDVFNEYEQLKMDSFSKKNNDHIRKFE